MARRRTRKQGKVAPVPVQVGVADGGMIQVSGALKPGQLVVVQGNERLRPGQDVHDPATSIAAAAASRQIVRSQLPNAKRFDV